MKFDSAKYRQEKREKFAQELSGQFRSPTLDFGVSHSPVSDMHPGVGALAIAREAMSHFNIPNGVEFSYGGMHRKSGAGAHRIDNGTVVIRAAFKSRTGACHSIDIPIVVREGRMLHPEIFLHQGYPKVLAQSSFDNLLKRTELEAQQSDRPHMFARPPSEESGKDPLTVENASLFSVAAALVRRTASKTPLECAEQIFDEFRQLFLEDGASEGFNHHDVIIAIMQLAEENTRPGDSLVPGQTNAEVFADLISNELADIINLGEDDFDEMSLEGRQAAPLGKTLAPALMGLGLGMASPDMAQATPTQQGPNQKTYQYSHQPAPGTDAQPWQSGNQLDPKQESKLAWLNKEMPKILAQYKGDKRKQEFFMQGRKLSMQSAISGDKKAAFAAHTELTQQYGPASPEVRAFKDGLRYGQLEVERIQLQQGGKQGRRTEFAPEDTGGEDCLMCKGTGNCECKGKGCKNCKGEGKSKGECEFCDGTGMEKDAQSSRQAAPLGKSGRRARNDCPGCDGKEAYCDLCGGTGSRKNCPECGGKDDDCDTCGGISIFDRVSRQAGAKPDDRMLDEAERDRSGYFQPGQKVSLANEVALKNRGGGTWTLKSGTQCEVVRDMFGNGDVMYVKFENGTKAPINSSDLR